MMKGRTIKVSRRLLMGTAVAGVLCACMGIAIGVTALEHSAWNQARCMNQMAEELMSREQYTQSAEVFAKVLAFDSDNEKARKGMSDAYVHIARSYSIDTGENVAGETADAAAAYYQAAIEYDESNLQAYRELADLYFNEQQMEEAFMTLRDLDSQYSKMLTPDYLAGSIVEFAKAK